MKMSRVDENGKVVIFDVEAPKKENNEEEIVLPKELVLEDEEENLEEKGDKD